MRIVTASSRRTCNNRSYKSHHKISTKPSSESRTMYDQCHILVVNFVPSPLLSSPLLASPCKKTTGNCNYANQLTNPREHFRYLQKHMRPTLDRASRPLACPALSSAARAFLTLQCHSSLSAGPVFLRFFTYTVPCLQARRFFVSYLHSSLFAGPALLVLSLLGESQKVTECGSLRRVLAPGSAASGFRSGKLVTTVV